MVYVFLANGFEMTEALVPVDMMRRAGIDVITAAVGGSKTVVSSHRVPVAADSLAEEIDYDGAEAVVLPGGQPGADNLYASAVVKRAVTGAYERGAVIGAICAAPYIFGRLGILRGRRAVCFPGYERELAGADVVDAPSVTDGRVITAKAAGCAYHFGYSLISALRGEDAARRVADSMFCRL